VVKTKSGHYIKVHGYTAADVLTQTGAGKEMCSQETQTVCSFLPDEELVMLPKSKDQIYILPEQMVTVLTEEEAMTMERWGTTTQFSI
jgi:hypothetical protein